MSWTAAESDAAGIVRWNERVSLTCWVKGETADLLILNHISNQQIRFKSTNHFSNQQIKPKSVNRVQLKAVIYFYCYWSSSHSLETILFLCWRSPSCSVTLFDSRNDLLFCLLSPRRENRLGKRKERNHRSDHSHYHLHYLVRQTPVRLSDLLSSLCLVNRALIPAFSPLTCSQFEMRSCMIWLRWFRVQKLLSCSNGKSFPMQPHSSCVRILSSSSTTSRTILSNSNRKHASSWIITASSSFLVFEAVVMSCERCCRRREMKKRKDRIGTILMLFWHQCILLRFLLSLCRLWPQLSVRLFFFLSLSLRFNRGSQRNLSSIILLRSKKTFKTGSRRSKSSYLFLVFSWSTLLTIGLRWLLPWTRLTSCANVVSDRRWAKTRSPLWYVLNFLSLNGEWEGGMLTRIHKASVGRNWATIFLDENFSLAFELLSTLAIAEMHDDEEEETWVVKD